MQSLPQFAPSVIDAVIPRLAGVTGRHPKYRATCPNCSRRLALSIGLGRDDQALLRCFAGCTVQDIAAAIGMTVRQLFPARDADELRARRAMRSRFAVASDDSRRRALAGALAVEIAKLRARIAVECGYERPLRASDHNECRQRVARRFGITSLPLVRAFDWETPGHDDDPQWPALYRRALDETMRNFWQWAHPDSDPWEKSPLGPSLYDRMRAERLAREWQRAMAK